MVKSLTAFSQVIVQDLGDRCHISTERDIKTITSRVKHEGSSFLTMTLPSFGKDFERSLDQGFVAHTSFAGFRRRGGLPCFIRGFLELVFDSNTGVLLDSPSVDAIFAVRELCSLLSKLKLPCSKERRKSAMDGWIRCEQDVRSNDESLSPDDTEALRSVMARFFADVFSDVDQLIYNGDLLPKHGPGSTAEYLSSNEKWSQTQWTVRMETIFPFSENLFPSHSWYTSYDSIDVLEPGAERPVRVISVPKTMKTPRIIAIEPACMQFMQQAISIALTDRIQGDDLLRNYLGWLDQTPNRELARIGSLNGELCTLDLSEASDRVSFKLVSDVLKQWPHLHEAVCSTRSTTARVPGHGVQPLAKFASMGSALCFPIETIFFASMVILGMERALGHRLSKAQFTEYLGRVRVYGDDIIVPTHMMDDVSDSLKTFGLKINVSKSFGLGKFRESCGGDFYNGHNVTPIKVRRPFPTDISHVPELVATSALRNQLFVACLPKSVAYLDRLLGRILPVYPEVPRTSSALGRWSFGPVKAQRSHPQLFKPQVKACVAVPRKRRDKLGGHGALMKWFLKPGDLPFVDKDHLERAGRAETTDIKFRWVSSL